MKAEVQQETAGLNAFSLYDLLVGKYNTGLP